MKTKIDYRNYETLGAYFQDVQGRVPLALISGIARYQTAHGVDFQTAYRRLFEQEAIIEIQ